MSKNMTEAEFDKLLAKKHRPGRLLASDAANTTGDARNRGEQYEKPGAPKRTAEDRCVPEDKDVFGVRSEHLKSLPKDHISGAGKKDAKPSKYRNRKVSNADGKFDSEREYRRWLDLRLLERSGAIEHLERQVRYEIAPACVLDGRKHPPLYYVADFRYVERKVGAFGASWTTVEDCKGFRTRVYALKRHLMKTVHSIEIRES